MKIWDKGKCWAILLRNGHLSTIYGLGDIETFVNKQAAYDYIEERINCHVPNMRYQDAQPVRIEYKIISKIPEF